MTTGKGVIGISSGEIARYAICRDSILGIQSPPGTICIPARGASIAENRNGIAERALEAGADWIFYMDDDQIFQHDTLLRLLADDKDVVSGLYLARTIPFIPHMYDKEDERGWLASRLLQKGDWGLLSVKSVGAGCLLVKTSVLVEMRDQGLAGSNGKKWWNLGQMKDAEDNWGDDHNFCSRVRLAGFEVWVDLEVPVGHQMTGTIWPKRNPDGTWLTILMQANFPEPIAGWPAAAPPLEKP